MKQQKKNTTTNQPTPRRARRRVQIELSPAVWASLKLRAARASASRGRFVSLRTLALEAVNAMVRGTLTLPLDGEGAP